MDQKEIEQLLDTLAEYESQVDLLNLDKQALLEQVKIPEEVQAIHEAGTSRKVAISREAQSRVDALDELMRDELAGVVIPPEIQAALKEIDQKRAAIQSSYSTRKQSIWGEAEKLKAEVDQEFDAQVANVYAEVATRKQEINAEYQGKLDAAAENIATLTAKIKKAVAAFGKTVHGQFKQAVFTRGRVTWNTDALDGYAEAHPEIVKYRKVGDPSVSIRANGK